MKKEELNNIKRVRFCNYSEYDSERCNDGGCYGFWTDYDRLENGKWEVSCGDFETVTETELLEIINNFTENEDEYIEYK